MNIRKVIQRRIRHARDGVDFVGDINAVISANVGEGPSQARSEHHRATAVSDSHEAQKEERDDRADEGPRAHT